MVFAGEGQWIRDEVTDGSPFWTAASAARKRILADGASDLRHDQSASLKIARVMTSAIGVQSGGRVEMARAITTAERNQKPALSVLLSGAARSFAVRLERSSDKKTHSSVSTVGPAAIERAACKGSGNFLPRRSARRRMPLHAVGLKKNRGGTGPVSKMSDNEDATPALGYSKVLSVKNAVGPPIPEFCQSTEEGAESACLVG